MSKFLKALENAQRERAGGAPPPAADDAPAARAVAAPPVVEWRPPPRPATADRPPVYGAPLVRPAPERRAARALFTADLGPVLTEPGGIDEHLVSLLDPTSFAAEQYRAVRLAIETFRRERDIRVVAVASPGRADGKTVSAINIAGALAQSSESRVVLVEADLRNPALAAYLGLSVPRGLTGRLLEAGTPAAALVERPAGLAFAVVPAGRASAMPYEMLKSAEFTALMADLRERFDYVVVDTPPAVGFPDVAILRDLVDGFVLVVRANHTPRESVADTVATLGRARALGVIFNDDDRLAAVAPGRVVRTGWRRYLGG